MKEIAYEEKTLNKTLSMLTENDNWDNNYY